MTTITKKILQFETDNAASPTANGELTINGAVLEYFDGTSAKVLVNRTATETLTNKTLTAPTISNPSLGGTYLDLTAMSAPANPSANNGRVYAKVIDGNNDGLFIKIKKAGSFVEVQIA